MEILLGIIIAILICIILIQQNEKSKRSKDIKYITEKLEKVIEYDSIEQIKVFTEDKEIKNLLIATNRLLDNNHKNMVEYNKTKISMKKMLSNISHDLKTPLTVILGYAEMLKLKNEENIIANKIYIKANEVLDLINKFFDLAKLESGDKNIEISKVNINEICRRSILDFHDIFDKENISADINIPEKDIYLPGNEEAIGRILNNLISNAIKYGTLGKYFGLNLKEEENLVKIEIIDKGKGIDDKYKEEVFERIYTLEDSRSKLYQGSGLGLTITKNLVEALGGQINLHSVLNEKTVFSFTLNKFNY